MKCKQNDGWKNNTPFLPYSGLNSENISKLKMIEKKVTLITFGPPYRIILKDRFGNYFKFEFMQSRNSVHEGFRKTHIMLKAKTGKILIYNYYDLKLRLRELYRQSVRNQIREEIRNELSSSEPLLSI